MGKTGLELLREPFPANQISKLPKATIDAAEYKKLPKVKCKVCGGFHPATNTIHLDYVGHAALTDRLLDADPNWNWEPLAYKDNLPAFDETGGLWIRLTVCGLSRLGYGNAKTNPFADVGSREKEVIGDALRNAAMRFGAALELWHKGELHIEDQQDNDDLPQKELTPPPVPPPEKPTPQKKPDLKADLRQLMTDSGITDTKQQRDFYQFVMDGKDESFLPDFIAGFKQAFETYKAMGVKNE